MQSHPLLSFLYNFIIHFNISLFILLSIFARSPFSLSPSPLSFAFFSCQEKCANQAEPHTEKPQAIIIIFFQHRKKLTKYAKLHIKR